MLHTIIFGAEYIFSKNRLVEIIIFSNFTANNYYIYNLHMDANIKKALIELLKEEVIVASWGLCKITVNDTSVKFEVSGFIYQGIVIIEIRNSKYKISFNDGTIMFCSTNNIVQMLDSKIEKGDEYNNNIKEWLLGSK